MNGDLEMTATLLLQLLLCIYEYQQRGKIVAEYNSQFRIYQHYFADCSDSSTREANREWYSLYKHENTILIFP